jgi:hypothetical protein
MIQATTALLLALVVLVPGWFATRLLALRVPSNPWLGVPLTVTAGIGSAAVPSTVSVLAGASMHWFVAMVLAWSVLVAVAATVLRRRQPAATRLVVPRSARAACATLSLLGAAVTAIRGTSFQSDSAVHASIVEKLVRLPHARFDQLGVVDDGRPVDSAILPVWHHLLALAASPFDHPGIVALWSGGAAVALFLPWAGSALGWAVTRTHTGAVLAATLTFGLVLAPWEGIPAAAASLAYPGNVAIYVVLPVLLCALVECVVSDVTGPAARPMLRTVALATAVVALLHLTYLYHVALAGLGMALVLVVLRPDGLRRLLAPAAVVAVVAVVSVGASLPVLRHAGGFGTGNAHDVAVRAQWGDVLDGPGSAIAPGYFLEVGGLALLGMLVAPLLLPATRGRNVPGAMLVLGPLLVLGVGARSDMVAGAVSGLGSFPPIPRTYKVVPWVLAIVVLVDAMDRAWGRRLYRSVALAVGVACGAVATAAATWMPGALQGRDTPKGGIDPVLPGWTLDAVLAVLAVELVVMAALVTRRRRARGPEVVDQIPSGDRSISLGLTCTLLATVLAVGVAGAVDGLGGRPSRLMHAEGLFGTNVANDATLAALLDTEPGSHVFTNDGAALRMAAAAPVYVAHTKKRSFSTVERRDAYRQVVSVDQSDAARLAYLRKYDIDLVLLPLPDEIRDDLRRVLGSSDQWRTVSIGGDLAGWRRAK